MIRATAAGSVDGLRGRLQRQPGGEQSLDDVVVEVTGDPFAFFEQPGGAGLFVQAGVLDRQAGGGGQSDRELLIDVGEHLAVGLVRQVQVAVDDAAQPDRHPEERRHRRVAGREPEAVRMGVEVGQPQRFRVQDQQPEDAVPLGASADAGRLLLAEPDRDELRQTGTPTRPAPPTPRTWRRPARQPTSVMRRNASARDCSDPIAITASSNRSNCFAPANSKRLGTTGGYDPRAASVVTR